MPTALKIPSKEDIIYAAGIFDGEGHISVSKATRKRKDGSEYPQHWLIIAISNTNLELMEWFIDKFGGSYRKDREGSIRTCWCWRLSCLKALKFLDLVSPYLIVKKNQVKLGMDFQKKIISSRVRTFSYDYRESYKIKISHLNRGIPLSAEVK